MAQKATYIYKVTLSNSTNKMTAYCYARNKKTALEEYKKLYKSEKFDHFEAVDFAEADVKLHPEYFKPLTNDEIDMINKNNLAAAGAYRRIRDGSELKGGALMSKEEVEELLR